MNIVTRVFRLIEYFEFNFQILMNVLTEATIAITMLDATILMLHLIALVILGIEEMALIVKVSSGFDLQSFYPVLKPTQTYSCQCFLIQPNYSAGFNPILRRSTF